jgi:thiol-disulfide isomerase/thioredoxin
MHIKHICYGAGDDVMSSLPNLKTYYLFEMNRKIIYSILFALIAMAGKGQIKCHVVGTVDDGVERQTFYISQLGTTENDDAKWTVVNVEDGHFSLDIAADTTEMYEMVEDRWQGGRFALFLVENDTVRITVTPEGDDARLEVTAGGPEQEKWLKMQRMSKDLFGKEAETIEHKLDSLYDDDLVYSEAYRRLMEEREKYDRANPDHVHALETIYARRDSMMHDKSAFSLEARKLVLANDSLHALVDAWTKAYKVDHPMLYGLLYLEARMLYTYDDINKAQPYLDEYHQIYEHLFPEHPAHHRIALKERGLRLQPGQPYFDDYEAATTDGETVNVASLYRGRMAIINLWGSWCGPCRAHAKALIPIYEKYRDAGLTVVAIAREWNMDSFRRAMEHDQYPWPSLVDYQDRYGVWEKHGIKNGSGKILLIDSDGTILSTTNDAQELEPIIKKALNID